ncbi:MAG: glutamate--tRNA ligase [Candidatus Doudnabacteria bacterium]|nr:glutamate--tRNA ligase [Candidatus Doudnabacteria bacterium]
MEKQEVRTRFAPSPTGFLHVGGLRTALYEFLWARKNNGKFILRLEDTDQERTVPGALENIVQTLTDFGLTPDEGFYWDNGVKERGEYGPYLQSKRLDIYKKHAEELIAKKAAYYCFCTAQRLEELRKQQQAEKLPPKYDKHCLSLSSEEVTQKLQKGEPHVVRLNVPSDKKIRFTDAVHGEIEVSSNDIDDQILLKSNGFPTYHLSVVVDDYLMKISHVIRGEEWIPSTPKHILLYSAFGWESPQFVHLPLLLNKSRKKLSKREGAVAVRDFLEKGYLPEALLNFVALLGWNPKTSEEIFNLRELVAQFSLDKLNKAGSVFDLDKLDWLNGMYLRRMKIEELFARCVPYLVKAGVNIEKYPKQFFEKILLLEQERLKKLSEVGERVGYFFADPQYDAPLLIWKNADKQVILKNLQALSQFLQTLDSTGFSKEVLERKIKDWIAQNNLKTGEVLWPLRAALTGLEASPGPFEVMDALAVLPDGKEIILKRINKAMELLF